MHTSLWCSDWLLECLSPEQTTKKPAFPRKDSLYSFCCIINFQGHSKSMIFSSLERQYATSYQWLIVTLAVFFTVSVLFSYTNLTSNLKMFFLHCIQKILHAENFDRKRNYLCKNFSLKTWPKSTAIGCLHDPANVQHRLLKVCWTFAGSCKHPITIPGSTFPRMHDSVKWKLSRLSTLLAKRRISLYRLLVAYRIDIHGNYCAEKFIDKRKFNTRRLKTLTGMSM